ncbi:MAG: hypothetical protein B6D71_14175 [gamma proteobacterium symbiont of Stewartia floridana]|nr:MAG: hypothetical protein B6D71_14175 [gamma proteobacterium symbiont of Stewartia floridana]
MSETPCFALLGELLIFSRQKISNQQKGRPAVTPLRVRCDARQKPAGLKLAALKQSGPLIGFCLRFSLVPERGLKREWLTIWQFLSF